MATVTVYDPTTRNTRTINVDMGGSIIIQDMDADYDYYVTLATSAHKKNGDPIITHIIRTFWSGAAPGGHTQRDGSPLPYANLTDAINDHIWDMVEGDLGYPMTAMDFTS